MQDWVNSLGIWWYVIFFFFVQLINVVFNTLKTIITSRAKKVPAAIINALTFGFYTLVIALTADIGNLWVNMVITVVANLIGVYFSIMVLDKLRKDRLWEITATAQGGKAIFNIDARLKQADIAYNFHGTNREKEGVFHIYSKNQKESLIVKQILVDNNAKYIVHEENKIL